MKVAEKEVQPAQPEYFVFTNENIKTRFDAPAEGQIGVNPSNDKESFVELTTVGENRWNGGMFVETGFAIESGKTYKVTLTTVFENTSGEGKYEIALTKGQWGANYEGFYDQEANLTAESRTFTADANEPLWLCIQFGKTIGKVTISNLLIEEMK